MVLILTSFVVSLTASNAAGESTRQPRRSSPYQPSVMRWARHDLHPYVTASSLPCGKSIGFGPLEPLQSTFTGALEPGNAYGGGPAYASNEELPTITLSGLPAVETGSISATVTLGYGGQTQSLTVAGTAEHGTFGGVAVTLHGGFHAAFSWPTYDRSYGRSWDCYPGDACTFTLELEQNRSGEDKSQVCLIGGYRVEDPDPSPAVIGLGSVNDFGGVSTSAAKSAQHGHEPTMPTSTKTHVASLGDSYSSGEGAGDYDASAGLCHRSKHAWPRLLKRYDADLEDSLLACSGAESGGLRGAGEHQVDQLAELAALEPAPTLITLTMGGNDVHFGPLVSDCLLSILPLAKTNCVSDGKVDATEHLIDGLAPTLEDDYREVQDADPGASLLVVGYPTLLPAKQHEIRNCDWLSRAPIVRTQLIALESHLNNVIEESARKAGATFVDVSDALQHHELCSADPWIKDNLTLSKRHPIEETKQELIHPNVWGQLAIAHVLASFIRSDAALR